MNKTVLVTGGTGFVGMQSVLTLLQKGYSVKTTVRSLSRRNEVIETLKMEGIISFEHLSFIEADLTKDDNWDEAVKDCDYVLHVASPFPATDPKDENELIIPARDGALRVLKAARDAGVKRVVLTSSFAAIGYSIDPKGHVFTEKDWTDSSAPLSAYIKSKTIAEKAAWDFISQEGGKLELTVINPVGIFGPALGKDHSSSLELIKGILAGVVKESPPFSFGAVDVRDVVDIHILAMLHSEAAGERFLAAAEGAITFFDIAQLIQSKRNAKADKVADMKANDPSVYIQLSNHKATTMLEWSPRSKEDAILASVDTLVS